MICLLLSATLSVASQAQTLTLNEGELLDVAESEYRAGLDARADASKAIPHFREAVATYEALWKRGIRNPSLARNLAQSYLLAGDLAHAIRAYQLGMRIAAHDPDLQSGLAFARGQVRYPVNGNLAREAQYHDRRSLLRVGPAWLFGAVAVAAYLFALLALARGWMSRRPVWWALGGTMMIVAILVAGAAIWEDKHLTDEKALPLAVVNKEGAFVHRGNGTEFPLRLVERLPEGVEVIVIAERGGWLQVYLGGGAVGWVDARQVVRVE